MTRQPEVRWPAGQPVHPLDYWLSPELARISPPEASSRLRQLADTQGTLAAAWSSAIAGGPVLALAGAFIAVLSGSIVWVMVLGLAGAGLTAAGLLSLRKARRTLPDTSRTISTRGPGNARGGIMMVCVLDAIAGAIFATTYPSAQSNGRAGAVIGSFLLFTGILTACILVPSAVMGRSRQSFRRRVQTDPVLRQAVEADLATWRDPYGNAAYGPLESEAVPMPKAGRGWASTIAWVLLVLASMVLIGYGIWHAGWHIWLPRGAEQEEVWIGNRDILAGSVLSIAAAVWSGAREDRVWVTICSDCQGCSLAGRC
ncbi:hypothetical protein QFZ35_003232 [Arthrobacter ulcerisalmonis]|nr:hypothetical protein [Arthrobacter ulcerisalmonis]MDQ0664734.1 hypothetical protein [Arthrobacter ulcerisalmonis]